MLSPSPACPFVVNLSHLRLLLWNRWTERRKQDLNVLYHVCVFHADPRKQDGCPASDWLRHFRLLWNRWKEFDETWQEARTQRLLPSLCFFGRSENQDGHPASDWLRHLPLLIWNRWKEFKETWQEGKSQHPLTSLCFSGWSENQDGVLTSDWLRHFRLV